MAVRRNTCPHCRRKGRWLEQTSRHALVNYYCCDDCGCVWNFSKDSPTADAFVTRPGNPITAATTLKSEPRYATPFHLNAVRVDFLRAELVTGRTMVKLARTSGNADNRRSHKHLAQQAYDSIVRYLPRLMLSESEFHEIAAGLEELRRDINQIQIEPQPPSSSGQPPP